MTTETTAMFFNYDRGHEPKARIAGPASLKGLQQGSRGYLSEERRLDNNRAAAAVDAVVYEKGNYSAAGVIRNVALRGVFIETDAEFAKDTYVQLRFDLTSEAGNPHFHRVWGRVAHIEGGIGVHLDILHPDTEAGLQALRQQAEKHH